MMEPVNSQRTRPSSDAFSHFWILILLMAFFVCLVVVLPNASSTPQPVESWSPEPVFDLAVPVTGSPVTTPSSPPPMVSTTPPTPRTIRTRKSGRGKNRVRNKTKMPIKKSKNRNKNKKTNSNQRLAAVVKNKIVVNFDAGIPLQHKTPSSSTKTAETVTPPQQIDGEMVTSWTFCSLLIVMVLWFAILKVQKLRGCNYRDLL